MTKKKSKIKIILFAFILALFSFALLNTFNKSDKVQNSIAENKINNILKINNNIFEVEIADTDKKREKGLSDRASLATNSAMLFIFDTSATQGFWMKDMAFDIDIIWIDASKKIIDIERNVSKNSYNEINPKLSKTLFSPAPIKYVLEINAGLSEKLNIKVGDAVEF